MSLKATPCQTSSLGLGASVETTTRLTVTRLRMTVMRLPLRRRKGEAIVAVLDGVALDDNQAWRATGGDFRNARSRRA
jgi:hypothetical protein